MIEKYNEGERTGNKFTGHAVEVAMRTEKVNGQLWFLPKEWLKWTSIDSYFSRETRRRRKVQLEQELGIADAEARATPVTATTSQEDVCPAEGYEQLDPDVEHTEDFDQDWLYDDTLQREDDIIHDSVFGSLDEMFDFA